MLLVTLANIFPTFCTESLKTIAHFPKRRRQCSSKNEEMRFCMINQIRNMRNPSPNAAFDNQRSQKVTLRLNKKHVLSLLETSQEFPRTAFLVTTKKKKPSTESPSDIFGPPQRQFRKFVFWCHRPNFFKTFVRIPSKLLYKFQNEGDHVFNKTKNPFF